MKKTLLALLLATASASVLADTGHSAMDHSKMDHSSMEHSMMYMEGMSAVGMPAPGAKPDKVVHVLLSDDMTIKFKKNVKIEPNDVVQFVVINTGNEDHEFVIGSPDEQAAHRKMMENPTGDHDHHKMGNVVYLKPGKAGQLLWHFHGEKKIEFACNIPGHFESGMVKTMTL